MLAPLVFGVLKRVKGMAGPGQFDVADLLAGQRANFEAAAPEETYAGPRFAASSLDDISADLKVASTSRQQTAP